MCDTFFRKHLGKTSSNTKARGIEEKIAPGTDFIKGIF